ncbi:type I pullulanase [Candidatus Xianfuyuplasma coldseepsis]|uniref:pullulanase n=1 Tax=Candidatus Xianfuyuplasma coldseepsis TaxID=2782163 RepID=A0A7L7KNL7_9MOLU|nr:type I pullulanase [Xianfuyuplasma coldseepsis]QMS84227.1 type I pullulanase [Xianfuyuplasma coldseepsis]
MKRIRVMSSILLFIVILLGVNYTNLLSADANDLVVHYHRYDGSYDEWSVWLWQDGIQGIEVDFTGEDEYGKFVTVDLVANNFNLGMDIGIIVAQIPDGGGAWIKDIDMDRYLDISSPNLSGEVHAYVLQGVEFISYVATDEVGCDRDNLDPFLCAQELSTGILDAYFDTSLDVNFLATDSIDAADITILENDVPVGFTGFISGTTGTLALDTTVNVSNTYMMEVQYGDTVVQQVIRIDAAFESSLFADAYHYDGWLGFDYSATGTTFRVWAPLSSAAEVNLYEEGHPLSMRSDGANDPYDTIPMEYIGEGVWEASVDGDLNGVYYTYNVVNSGSKVIDIQDPYGVTFGLNGQRAMVLDLDSTDPEGWDTDSGVDGFTNPNEAIIYELHVRDLTSDGGWNGPDEYAGLYMGFTVAGTSYTNSNTGVSVSTGLDHLIELGITHVHLLPTYDQDWNDERDFQFNWGYNPQNYNSPEGGYSTDPYDGAVRVNEYKQMVMALHSNGINVINDVVYNHTGPGASYSFNRIVPNYFYRFNSDGSFSNGTGVGNETATERYMVDKFIVDSVTYWAEEYHIDGFRFDLMAVHDYHNMNNVANAVEAIDPDIFVYGEPWGGGAIAIDYSLQAGKQNLYRMPLIAAFNDQIRNAIKGSPDGDDPGYISTGTGITDIMRGIEGSINWGFPNSAQSVNYVSAHDNLTLIDKLLKTKGLDSNTYYLNVPLDVDYEARLANSIVMFSQGTPFLHAGVDFLRTKYGDHNSYSASDSVNQLDWSRKAKYVDSFEYYKGIIEIRKEYDSFKMVDKADIEANLDFLNPPGFGMIGYRLTKNGEDILVYHNGGAYDNDITLPAGAWKLLSDRDEAGLDGLGTYATRYPIYEAETLVFVRGDEADVIESPRLQPIITNRFGITYEGQSYTINSTTDIYAYSINGGAFVPNNTHLSSVDIEGLTPGTYDIRIQDMYGSESEPFTITVLENDPITCDEGYHLEGDDCVLDVLTCDEGYHQEGTECVLTPLTCDEGYHQEGTECVSDVLTCEEGYVISGTECVKIDDKPVDSGCFSRAIIPSSVIIITSLSGAIGLYLLRKKQ